MSAAGAVVEHPMTPEDVARSLADRSGDRLPDGAPRGVAGVQGVEPVALPAVASAALDGGTRSDGVASAGPEWSTVGRSVVVFRERLVAAAPEPRRRRRRKAGATGTVRVVWRAKGPMWLMKYRLPDGTESMRTLGAAWVKRNPQDPEGWLPRRGRPPEGTLNEDAARAALQAFLDRADRSDTAGADHARALRRRLP